MMYARPYRAGLPFERVQQELIDFSGTQFDPAIVKIYLEAVRFFGQAEEPTQEKDNVVAYLQRKSA
jgi:HD-GYP domain-containing protein (c-di-GMP phosphodiesterase class II)